MSKEDEKENEKREEDRGRERKELERLSGRRMEEEKGG